MGFTLFFCPAIAQKVEKGTEFWPQYYLNLRIDSNWSVSSDYSSRYNDAQLDQRIQWIARAGLGFQLTKNLNISAGFAYSEYFSAAGVRRENRPWQQLQLANKFNRFTINNRLRLEERSNKDVKGEKFNYRLRYQLQFQVPLLARQRLALMLSDEPMINFGKQVSGNIFDQNRLMAALQVKFARNLFFIPAYQHTYQIQSNKKDFKSLDILRTGIIYKN